MTCNALATEAGTRFTLAPAVVEGLKKRHEAGFITRERLDELLAVPPPEYLSPFVVYLASDANMNGQVFRAAGGEISLYSEPVRMKSIFKREGKLRRS